MGAVKKKDLSHQKIILVKIDVFGVNKKVKKVQKGPEVPKPIFSEGGGSIMRVVGKF